MKRIAYLVLAGPFCASPAAAAAQSDAQATASADTKTCAQAGKSGAAASNNTSGNASAQAGKNSASLAQGTTMNAVLTKRVDCKKNKPGDTVTGKTTENTNSDGEVVIPKGPKLVGHVTEAKARGKGESESSLGIVFDKAILKNGQEVPLNANIQAPDAADTMASGSLEAPDLAGSGLGSASSSGSARSSGGGGLVGGGVASTAGGAAGSVTTTAANVVGTTNRPVGSTGTAAGSTTSTLGSTSRGAVGGLNAAGQLTSTSQGVFGLNGLKPNAAGSNSTHGSLITSTGRNVPLNSGTRMLLAAKGQVAAQVESSSSAPQ